MITKGRKKECGWPRLYRFPCQVAAHGDAPQTLWKTLPGARPFPLPIRGIDNMAPVARGQTFRHNG
jgi:hypothetical protein